KMWSGSGMRGKNTTFGSGKTGMTSGSVIAGSRHEAGGARPPSLPSAPASRAVGARRKLQAEAPHARAGPDPIDPGLHGRERRLELDTERSQHHDARRERGVGEGELAPAEEVLSTEPVTEEVESTPQLLARLIHTLWIPFCLRLAHLCQEHRRRRNE